MCVYKAAGVPLIHQYPVQKRSAIVLNIFGADLRLKGRVPSHVGVSLPLESWEISIVGMDWDDPVGLLNVNLGQ